ncbi:single-stranded DNA-binding protein [Romboutsia weinsteinii]|uniref:Single-stranded DNA-binding protein n=1 Tax=Romboutsia weinsteinii TaxID=2020949 RepID=A0A371J323_9FIRM|nr:single-stranded DNA-binding protein [Romboutsia weinsteinii]RDY27179.1 single-stranded DNA-binding protein [Romboutsia weinsteinii]
MNNVTLVGRLTKDPELRYVGNTQSAVADFILAVDRKWRGQDGTKKTDFIRVELWGKQAEICAQYLIKGRLIGIEGELRVDSYQTTNGENKSITKVKAHNFTFLESRSKHEKYSEQTSEKHYDGKDLFKQAGINPEELEDELPF